MGDLPQPAGPTAPPFDRWGRHLKGEELLHRPRVLGQPGRLGRRARDPLPARGVGRSAAVTEAVVAPTEVVAGPDQPQAGLHRGRLPRRRASAPDQNRQVRAEGRV
ncbi:MAG TPA: hypothetical protein VLA19_10485, partial [Herpetosiphonaceae bacterium]|nr:hypothetical protein [Herpetosiphonaceae bacterium]